MKVLVTGATGRLGRHTVRRLAREGYGLRVLARDGSRVTGFDGIALEVAIGDVSDRAAVERAMAGIDVVIHAAAGTSGRAEDAESATIRGTRNIVEVARALGTRRLIYISTCSVYDIVGHEGAAAISEESPLEPHPEWRGTYSSSKQMAESMVLDAVRRHHLPAVTLRPGAIYGDGADGSLGRMLGSQIGSRLFVVYGTRDRQLPLVHVENVVQAILQALRDERAVGEVFNVVDPETITSGMYIREVLMKENPRLRFVRLPLGILLVLARLVDLVHLLRRGAGVHARYRLWSSQRPVRFDGRKIQSVLGWDPVARFADSVRGMYQHGHGET